MGIQMMSGAAIRRPQKIITCLALILILVQTTGCASYRPVSPDLRATEPTGLDVGKRYRFSLKDGRQEILYFYRADSLVIVGHPKKSSSELWSLRRDEIQRVEEQFTRGSWDKIVIGSGVVLASVFLWSVLLKGTKDAGKEVFCDIFPDGKGC